MATANRIGVRSFLQGAGYNDNEIKWDPNTKAVTARGQYFGSYNPEADGNTYDTTDNLQANLRSLNSMNREKQLQPLVDALVGQAKAPAPAPFHYDPGTDPAYQSALNEANRNAQTASNNAMVATGARGIGNSSITTDRVAQIQQQALGHVTDTVLPQLEQQAYQRYLGDQNLQQNSFQNLSKVADFLAGLGQQDFNNGMALSQDARANKQANLNAATQVGNELGRVIQPKSDWGLLYTQNDAPPNYQAQQDTTQNARADRQANATIANMNADNVRAAAADARAAGNQHLAQLFDIWDRTGEAPAGIPGVTPGKKLYDQVGSRQDNQPQKPPGPSDYKTSPDFADEVAYIKENPTTALADIEKNAKTLIQKYGYDGYLSLKKEATPKEGN